MESPSQLLSDDGQPVLNVSDWKRDMERRINTIKFKDFPGYYVKQGSDIKFITICKPWDFFTVDHWAPKLDAYGDGKDQNKTEKFALACQAFSKLESSIQELVKKFISPNLFEVFIAAPSIKQGYDQILADSNNFQEDVLHIVLNRIRTAAQGHSTYYQYTLDFQKDMQSLERLGYATTEPARSIWQKEAADNYRVGISESDAPRLTARFDVTKADTFEKMRVEVIGLAREDLKRQSRQANNSTMDSAKALQVLPNQPPGKPKPTGIPRSQNGIDKGTRHRDPATTLVVKNLPNDVSKENLKTGFSNFGQVMDVYVLNNRQNGQGAMAFIRYGTKDAVDAALKSKPKSIAGLTPVFERSVKKDKGVTQGSMYQFFEIPDENKPTSALYSLSPKTILFKGVVDSGCTPNHITPNVTQLSNVRNSGKIVRYGTADHGIISSNGLVGSITVPGAAESLISVYDLVVRQGLDVWFTTDKDSVHSVNIGHLNPTAEHEIIAKGFERKGLFELEFES
ncbi:hypothetical protein HDU79_001204, partial [Rhizoclosmatium sp. JEL0117]